ncbi:type II toxin-antitoxin system HicA family toxin [Spirosoma sp.]|uniref:type II toxin-antitoxin system HicA family toxin n=1 Tax=Spirosoma sp. TaxID=1899569 RepID=UPI00260A269D|nr:type II toxin-antitoxin system HicA family toxin [Spirosoma sp.]MCX6216418.1 type II toxin-antitoxin system HicA family toxin [Spirosoma sp.]
MKASELTKLLKSNGWQEVRQSGSHLILKHEENPNNLSVPIHGKKDVPIGTLNDLLKKAGLK